jgi:glucan phosphorylase
MELIILPDLSLEFLMGRALDNAMLNVGMKDVARGVPRLFSVKIIADLRSRWFK